MTSPILSATLSPNTTSQNPPCLQQLGDWVQSAQQIIQRFYQCFCQILVSASKQLTALIRLKLNPEILQNTRDLGTANSLPSRASLEVLLKNRERLLAEAQKKLNQNQNGAPTDLLTWIGQLEQDIINIKGNLALLDQSGPVTPWVLAPMVN